MFSTSISKLTTIHTDLSCIQINIMHPSNGLKDKCFMCFCFEREEPSLDWQRGMDEFSFISCLREGGTYARNWFNGFSILSFEIRALHGIPRAHEVYVHDGPVLAVIAPTQSIPFHIAIFAGCTNFRGTTLNLEASEVEEVATGWPCGRAQDIRGRRLEAALLGP